MDKGAGEGVKVVLMKRADDSTNPLPLTDFERTRAETIGRLAIGDQEEIEKREKRDRDDEDHDRFLKIFRGMRVDDAARSAMSKVAEELNKSYAATARGDEADLRDRETSADELVGTGNDHPAHRAADLLVQSGSHNTHEDALAYLLHHPRGAALLRRLTKHEDQPTMSTTPEEKLSDLVKRVGITAIAAEIIKSDSAYSISEHELTTLVTEQARRDYPTLSPAQAFTKMFTEQSEAGTILRKAFAVVKAAGAAPYFDLKPLVVDGADALDVDDPAKAVAQLQELGRQKWPSASEAEQFARAFDDPANAKLAAKAHRRPTPTTLYPFPK